MTAVVESGAAGEPVGAGAVQGDRAAGTAADGVPSGGNTRQLALTLVTSGLCIALFGTVPGMLPAMTERLGLTEGRASFMLSLLIFVGAAGRIPLGMATDRFGGRRVLPAVLLVSLMAPLLMPLARTYGQALACAVLFGVPLASYSVCASFVAGWYPPRRQGMALGLLGLGQFGQSFALFGAPLLVGWFGYRWGFWAYSLVAVAWLPVLWALVREAPRRGPRAGAADFVRPLQEQASWIFSLFYFLTMGGLLTMAAYLPKFLTQMFDLTRQDAGMRAAGFVCVGTLARPVGGWLADHVGARRILHWVFPFAAAMAGLMVLHNIVTFTVGALGIGLLIGLGNGAVFKLVPQQFPRSVGAVTGIVGAFGVLGASIPPIVLGIVRERTHSYGLGFVLLAAFSLACWGVILRTCSRCYRIDCDEACGAHSHGHGTPPAPPAPPVPPVTPA